MSGVRTNWTKGDCRHGPSKGTAVDTSIVSVGELNVSLLEEMVSQFRAIVVPDELVKISICKDPDCDIVKAIKSLPDSDFAWMSKVPIVENQALGKNSALLEYADGKAELYMKHKTSQKWFTIDMGQRLCLKHWS